MCLPLYNDNSPKVVHKVPCLYISILSALRQQRQLLDTEYVSPRAFTPLVLKSTCGFH